MRASLLFFGLFLGLGVMALPVAAQDNARGVRDSSLQASRYELLLGKLQDQNEDLMSQVRTLQKANEALAKDVQAANARSQNVADALQRLQNTDFRNVSAAQKQINDKMAKLDSATPWGEAQRNCDEIGVKHQQIKVVMSPDGKKSVRFLCFDGKALLLGSEVYAPVNP